MKLRNNTAMAVPLQRLVGRVGEFRAANGAILQCVITGYDLDPPFGDECLIIDYIHEDGSKVQGAMIPVALFRADSSPNSLLGNPETT